VRASAPGGHEAYRLLPERYSMEIISPVVRQDDVKWLQVVKSVLAVLIAAEQCGLTQQDVSGAGVPAGNIAAVEMFKRAEQLAKPLGLTPGWAQRVVRAVGNYGEVFERNLGRNSPIKLERGPNRLVRDGGLTFAPPF